MGLTDFCCFRWILVVSDGFRGFCCFDRLYWFSMGLLIVMDFVVFMDFGVFDGL